MTAGLAGTQRSAPGSDPTVLSDGRSNDERTPSDAALAPRITQVVDIIAEARARRLRSNDTNAQNVDHDAA